MPAPALRPLILALLSHLPEDPTSLVITVKGSNETTPVAGRKTGTMKGPVYDPAAVYILELCTVLALRDAETTKIVGNDVADALQSVIRQSSGYHNILVARSMFYLLHLLRASHVRTPLSLFILDQTDLLGTHIYPSADTAARYCESQEEYFGAVGTNDHARSFSVYSRQRPLAQ